jgi:hypothetical protein
MGRSHSEVPALFLSKFSTKPATGIPACSASAKNSSARIPVPRMNKPFM